MTKILEKQKSITIAKKQNRIIFLSKATFMFIGTNKFLSFDLRQHSWRKVYNWHTDKYLNVFVGIMTTSHHSQKNFRKQNSRSILIIFLLIKVYAFENVKDAYKFLINSCKKIDCSLFISIIFRNYLLKHTKQTIPC